MIVLVFTLHMKLILYLQFQNGDFCAVREQ